VLDQLLGPAVQKTDMRVHALHDLTVELQYQTQYAVSRRMLGPEIEGEIAQVSFGHNGLASAAGSTLAADAGSRSIRSSRTTRGACWSSFCRLCDQPSPRVDKRATRAEFRENRSNLPFSCFPRLRCRFAYGRTRRTRRCEARMRHCLGPPPQVLLPSTPSTRRKGRPPWPPVVLL
jgi:hypothetical protein